MQRVDGWLIILSTVFNTVAVLAAADERTPSAKCNFDAYQPLRIGTPIRGGHEELAIEKTAPVYPAEAQQKGIGGHVDVRVLINRAGDVVRACALGAPLLAQSAEGAVLQWKFQKDFGVTFSGKPPVEPRYAVLNLSFDFQPSTGGRDRVSSTVPSKGWVCSQESSAARDERGVPIWLGSDDLARRIVQKADLEFPMLDGSRLRGEVKLNILIDEKGELSCAVAISGHPIAIASAMTAIRSWRFKPFTQRERAVPVLGHLTIPYSAGR